MRITEAEKYNQFCFSLQSRLFNFDFFSGKLHTLFMKRYFLSTICLIVLLFGPVYAQELVSRSTVPGREPRARSAEHLDSVSENNYLNQLALRGFNLESQGLLIESLDGRTTYAELNSNVGFNPASVIKVATSFAALSKFGPEYHFETNFYADGTIDKKTRTLKGDLVLQNERGSFSDLDRCVPARTRRRPRRYWPRHRQPDRHGTIHLRHVLLDGQGHEGNSPGPAPFRCPLR